MIFLTIIINLRVTKFFLFEFYRHDYLETSPVFTETQVLVYVFKCDDIHWSDNYNDAVRYSGKCGV